MDPNHPNYRPCFPNYFNSQNYQQSSEYPSSQNFSNFAPPYQNPQSFSNLEYSQNFELSPNLSQILTSTEIPTSNNVTQNLFGDAQQANIKEDELKQCKLGCERIFNTYVFLGLCNRR